MCVDSSGSTAAFFVAGCINKYTGEFKMASEVTLNIWDGAKIQDQEREVWQFPDGSCFWQTKTKCGTSS